MSYLTPLWPAEYDLAYQYLLFLIGQPLATLTRIGDANGQVTIATTALVALGPLFFSLAGLYIGWKAAKGLWQGKYRSEWWTANAAKSAFGPLVAFLVVIPIPGIGGFTISHSIVMYAAVTSIGFGNWISVELADRYSATPIVAHGNRRQIHPVSQQVAMTMLQARICMNVINTMEAGGATRTTEYFQREFGPNDNDVSGISGIGGLGGELNSSAAAVDPLVQQAAMQYGVPAALIHAVIKAESDYDPTAVSTAGAVGLMQLMPATATRFGVDDRNDPEQSIHGGTAYLAFLLDRYNGNVQQAVGAYNCGEGCMDDIIAGDRAIPSETQAYIPKVMGFYGVNAQQGIAGAPGGTLHVKRIMWGGGEYPKDACGELEFPIAFTATSEKPAHTALDQVVTTREIEINTLEAHITTIASAMMEPKWDKTALADALMRAMMDYDFRMHVEAATAYQAHQDGIINAFLDDVRQEGWVAYGQYFTRIGELLQALSAGASYGIEPRGMVSPQSYMVNNTATMLAGYLARIDALLDEASRGKTEAEKFRIAREIAAANGYDALADEIEIGRGPIRDYVFAWNPVVSPWLEFLDHAAANNHPKGKAYLALSKDGGEGLGLLRTVADVVLTQDGRFPLFKYQEIGETLLGTGSISKGLGIILPGSLGDFAAMVAAIQFTTGFVLGVFLPLFPQVIWTIVVATWFITFLLLMAVAPVWGLFHISPHRALVGWFAVLKFSLLACFAVMAYTVAPPLLMALDNIVYNQFVSTIMQYVREQDYILTLCYLFVYGVVALAITVMCVTLPLMVIEKIFIAVDAYVPTVARIDPRELARALKAAG